MHLKSLSVLIAIFSVIAVACASSVTPVQDSQDTTEQSEASVSSSDYERPDEVPLIKGPLSPDGLQAIFGTPDLGIGTQRIAVVLTSKKGLVRSPVATITSFYFSDENAEGELRETTLGFFRPFPANTRGIYTTNLNFDQAGKWGLEIDVLDENAQTLRATIQFEVLESADAPTAGSPAVLSVNKTVADVESLADITTGSLQDPDLYQITIADAVETGLPTVVVMASPAFCTNAVCGPQVDVLQELKDKYKGDANFIHVDFYDNPQGIQGDLNNAVISPTVIEWNLPSTEWSFVIDRQGIVSARFESFATFEEIEEALLELL